MEAQGDLVTVFTAFGEVNLPREQYEKAVEAATAVTMPISVYLAELLKLAQRVQRIEEREAFLSNKELELKPIVKQQEKVCRNAVCVCGSGVKFKNCCLEKKKVDFSLLERFLNSVPKEKEGECDAGTIA